MFEDEITELEGQLVNRNERIERYKLEIELNEQRIIYYRLMINRLTTLIQQLNTVEQR
jgi:benzoyl-CoA reductase/2-hydroxyglutaryl-CoA dehydratase subunit BcrC/BadD/HgdB